MTTHKWTWPEYEALSERIDEFTGKKADPSKRMLADIFGEPEKPMSVEERAELERKLAERVQRRKRLISDYELSRHLRFKFSRVWSFRKMVLSDDQLEWWEHPHSMSAETVARLAFPSLSETKLENRIRRFDEAAERMSAFADLLEERLEEEGSIRRLK